MTLDHGWLPWVALIFLGVIPSEIWRMLAIFASRGLDERSPILRWVRAVATALLAGIVGRLLFTPGGALVAIPLAGRIGAMALGLLVFWATRRSVFAAVVCAEAALIATGYLVR